MSVFMWILFGIGGGVFVLITVGLIWAKLYTRASKEVSFVRTGAGGQKVIMNTGSAVLPVLHEIIPVNMNTLRLEVQRTNEQALITRDRMRVDVQAEFYVRVKPTADSIAVAAQTLGKRTMDPRLLKELVEGKFVDALRSVAAEMAMEELHEQRVDFVQKVQTAVTEDLFKNGLELESVSLTSLDQTDQKHFNPQNLFDARGLTRLTEEIEARKKQRNDIEKDTEVEIQKKNLSAEQQSLEISKQEEYSRLEQQREIEIRRAEQQSNIAMEQAEKERQAKEAQIKAKQQIDQAQLLAERGVEEERIEKERLIKEKDIDRAKAIETAEIEQQKSVTLADITADRSIEEERIEKERLIKEKDIARGKAIEMAEIERKKSVELADQDKAIAIAEKSKEKSVAQAEADKALALAVTAEEKVITAREAEIAERQKTIELVEARKQAERDAIGITVAAEAEKKAAVDRAEAMRTVATGEADKVKIASQAEADAEIVKAEAAEKRYAVEAEGKRAIHEAENILSPAIIEMQIKMAMIENLDKIIRESVKPMEAIEGIKIIQLGGLGSGSGIIGNGNAGEGQAGKENLAEQLVSSALRYRTHAPLIDSLLKELGISGGDLEGLTAAIKPPIEEKTEKTPLPEKDQKDD